MRHKGIPKWIVLLGRVQIGTDPLKIGKSSFLKGPLIGLWFEKIIFKLKLRSIFICQLSMLFLVSILAINSAALDHNKRLQLLVAGAYLPA